MTGSIRMKTKLKEGTVTVRAIIRHPMETGFRTDEDNHTVPAHYIKTVKVHHNENEVLSCDWSRAISKNPYLSFIFENAVSGDKIKISWIDNLNNVDSAETIIQ